MNVRFGIVKLHLWLGLLAAPVLLVLGVTGAMLVVEPPIADRLNAKTAIVAAGTNEQSLAKLLASVRGAYPDARLLAVQLPPDRSHSIALTVRVSPRDTETVLVDPYTARVLGTAGQQPVFFQRVRQLHRQLLLGRSGSTVVVWVAVALAVLAISGPVIWWPRRRIGVRWGLGGWRRVLDLHAVLGAISCAFLFLFAVTGAVVHWEEEAQHLIGRVTGTPFMRVPPNLAGTSCDGSAMLDADALMAAGVRVLPGARPTSLRLPDARSTLARMSLKYPEDRTPNGRSILMLDACTGRAAYTIDTRSAPLAYLYPREWNRELHTGDVFGWPTQVLALILSLTLAAMGIIGPLTWVMRPRREAAGRASGPRSTPEPRSPRRSYSAGVQSPPAEVLVEAATEDG